MKWQPVAAMLALIALALWLVLGEAAKEDVVLADGAHAVQLRIGTGKGWVEVKGAPGPEQELRVRFAGERVPPKSMTRAEFTATFGDLPLRLVDEHRENWFFNVLNITSWVGLAWVVLGFVGQALFFARLLVQWIASEREQRSVVPVMFWWFSLLGGVMLFAYFVWRRDIVGVLGQTTGVVVYMRNLRLIYAAKLAPTR
jgi:lipid-A-disaccharide synthase-like uncharacterized protein